MTLLKEKMKKSNKEEFIKKAKQVHGDKYDYSKVNYINSQTKVCIISSEYGEFWQRPNDHLHGQENYLYRNKKISEKLSMGKNIFIEKAESVHGNKYDYSKVGYINNRTKVCIICPEHGEFWQTPDKHINRKQGCPICGRSKANIGNINRNNKTAEEFTKRANIIHGYKYNYSKVNYINVTKKVCIICPEHGEFWQTPGSHIYAKCGCPKCSSTPVLEKDISDLLMCKNIKYIEQKTFSWLIGKSKPQRLDFYLPDCNIAIECQGEQHFKPIKYFGGINKYNTIVSRDVNKYNLCKEHGIDIIYYSKNNIVPINFNKYYVIKSKQEIELYINNLIQHK